ncbi:MAG: SDR family NAD(P)-dependent oxidoreductase [Hyphomicrobiaceae bacterium]
MAEELRGLELFKSEVALVTGSASNIGKEIAIALSIQGAHIILADVDGSKNQVTADEILGNGGSCDQVVVDLAQADGWKRLLPSIEGRLPSIYVHSACPPRVEHDTPLRVAAETFDEMLAVNVRSGFLIGRELGRRMVEEEIGGRMLFITSLHAGSPRNLPHYSASKAGLTMVMKELARDLAPHGVRVNAVAPGALPGGGNTNITEEFGSRIPVRRVGSAADIVGPSIALLADCLCGYVTGATLPVDGGLSLVNWIPFADQ